MKELKLQYKKILSEYIMNQSERNLYMGQNFVRQLIQRNVAPEDVVDIHKQILYDLYPELPQQMEHSFDFLIEIMIHFGLTLKEHRSLIEMQEEPIIEMNIASNIQSLFSKTTVPKSEFLDVGFISIPVREMKRDYVHFINGENNYLSVAVTDVVGEGVPAALCMMMVKSGLDTLEYADNYPSSVLSVLNKIIEKSVDDSMFVSMFYGRYDFEQELFTYGSAGHESAIYYSSHDNEFYELDNKGLLLGIMPEVQYHQKHLHLNEGDIVIMLTDGVTEFRTESNIVPQDMIKEFILLNKHFSAHEMCERLYQQLLKMQKFDLLDDFTVVILKKNN